MGRLDWFESVIEIISVIACAGVVNLLYLLLRGGRQSSVKLTFKIFGVLLLAIGLVWFADQRLNIYFDHHLGLVLKTFGFLVVLVCSIALLRLLPRAIAFRDRDLIVKASKELRQSKSRFDRALRGAPTGLWEWNVEADEIWFSPRYRELLGYGSEAEFPNSFQSWEATIHPDDRERTRQALDRQLKSHDDFEIELRLLTKSGEYRWFLSKGIAIKDNNGMLLLLSGSIQDIHEQKNLQQSARKLDEYAMQKHKLESLGELAGSVAHEFNNCLQAIYGQLQIAEHVLPAKSPVSGELTSALELVEHASQVTRRLLCFSRKRNAKSQVIHPNTVLAQLKSMLSPLLGKRIKLVFKQSKKRNCVAIDPIAIQQALINLSINANDAMAGGGTLTVGVRHADFDTERLVAHANVAPGSYVGLYVSDTGHGIPPEIRKRLFEPFFTTKDAGHGTGLGLAIVAAIAQENRGFVEVESQPGAGSTFCIWLPAAKPKIKTSKSKDLSEGNHSLATILYVEDDGYIRRNTARQLRLLGFRVAAARDGTRALNVFRQRIRTINLAVLDVSMPGLSGVELFRQIREASPDLPVVFCTAYPSQLYSDRILSEKNTYLVQKPFKFEALLQAINECLSAPITGKPEFQEDIGHDEERASSTCSG